MRSERSNKRLTKLFIPLALVVGLAAAVVFAASAPQSSSQHKVLFEKAKFTMETKGDLRAAIELFEEIIQKYPNERDYAAKSLYLMGTCYEKLGERQAQQAQAAFQRIVQDYPDQTEEVDLAKEKLLVLEKVQMPAERGEDEFRIRKIGPIEVLGAPSPDGSLISFVDWDTGDLALYEAATGKKKRITNKGSWAVSSDFAEESIFSPDGSSIAFNWYSHKDLRFDLRTIKTGGTGLKVLYGDEDVYFIWPCAWTPDGKHILAIVTNNDQLSRIVLISAADGTARTIKEFESGAPGKLGLSPDGRWVAFSYPNQVPWGGSSEKRDIYLIALDGSHEVAFVKHPADDLLLGWTPDGMSILFSSDRAGSWDSWIQPVKDGEAWGNPRLLRRDWGDPKIVPMGFTKDGSFFYGVRVLRRDVYIAPMDPATGGPASRAEKAALRFEGANAYPCWSPDGTQLAYTSFRSAGRSEPAVLCIKSLVSGEERDFHPGLISFATAAWFPDGRSVLLRGIKEDRKPALFRYDLSKGYVSKLIDTGTLGGLHGPIAFQGQRILYDLDDRKDNVFRIMSYDLETGQKKEILRGNHQFLCYDLSPDGRWLFFREGGIKRMPLEGGDKQTLLELGEGEGINSIASSPDGRFVYFSKFDKGSSKSEARNLWRIPAEGGIPVKYDLVMDGLENLRFHPDGNRLAFSSWHIEAEAWVMENFLPKSAGGK
jgi:Tol biopolymer transport system component